MGHCADAKKEGLDNQADTTGVKQEEGDSADANNANDAANGNANNANGAANRDNKVAPA